MARAAAPSGLMASLEPLSTAYDLLLVDLDGVAYLGDQPIDGAAQALTGARAAGVRVAFVTNNASRTPAVVASQLSDMGVAASPQEVMTSSVGAAAVLAARLPGGSAVLAVGGAGVRAALVAAGLSPVTSAGEHPVAVLQGFGPEVAWADLAEACVAIRAGAAWVATNTDATLPSPRGPLPGNGSLVAALERATGQRPEVIGKPAPSLFDAVIAGGRQTRPLVVGDRLDTDIAGAHAAGLPSLLVLSGVSGPTDLIRAQPSERPTYLGLDLRAVGVAHPAVEVTGDTAVCGAARVWLDGGVARVDPTSGPGERSPDGLDPLRALCGLAWRADQAIDTDAAEVYEPALKGLDLN